VRGNPLALMEEFNGMGADAGLELVFDQGVRHRVVVATDLDVIIDIKCGRPHLISYVANFVMWRQRYSPSSIRHTGDINAT